MVSKYWAIYSETTGFGPPQFQYRKLNWVIFLHWVFYGLFIKCAPYMQASFFIENNLKFSVFEKVSM